MRQDTPSPLMPLGLTHRRRAHLAVAAGTVDEPVLQLAPPAARRQQRRAAAVHTIPVCTT